MSHLPIEIHARVALPQLHACTLVIIIIIRIVPVPLPLVQDPCCLVL